MNITAINVAVQIAELAAKLIQHCTSISDDEANECWQEISRIAAENAAKPEIDGVSLHE